MPGGSVVHVGNGVDNGERAGLFIPNMGVTYTTRNGYTRIVEGYSTENPLCWSDMKLNLQGYAAYDPRPHGFLSGYQIVGE